MQTDNKTANLSRPNRKLVEQLRSLRSRLARLENNSQSKNQPQKAPSGNESYLSTILDNVSDVISYVDKNGLILNVNKRVEDLLGYTPNEVIGKNFAELGAIQPKDLNRINADFEHGLKTQIPHENYQLELIHKNGKKVTVEINTSFIKNNGKVEHIVNIFRDITERKMIEEKLLEHIHLNQLLLDSLPCVALLMRTHTREIVASNKAAIEVGAVPGKTCFETWAKSDSPCSWCLAPELWATGKEQHLQPEAGGRIWDAHWLPISDNLYMHYAFDITEEKRNEKALRKQQYYLKKAQEIGRIGTWELDISKNELIWTDENYRVFGVPLGTPLTYEVFLDRVHPDDRDYVDTEWKAALSSKPYDIEHRLIVDGKIRWVREKAQVEFDQKGNPINAIGFTQDITERKKAEEELRFFHFAIDRCSDAAFWMGPDAKLVYVNDAACRSLGYSYEELLSKTVHDIDPNFSSEAWPDHWNKFKQQDSMTFESSHRSKDGRVIPVEISANYLVFQDREYSCAFARDITERKKAEKTLRESEEKYRRLFETLNEGIWRIDAQGYTTFVNPKMAEMLGYTVEEMTGEHLFAFMDDKCVKEAKNKLKKRQQGTTEQHEFTFRKKTGEPAYMLLNTSPVFDEQGNYAGALAGIADISERKKAEQALKESEEKYRTFVKNFQGIAYRGDINTWTPLFFNGAVEQTTGYKEEDFIAGKPRWDQIIHPDDLPNLPGKEEIASTPNYSVEREYRIIRKDGKIRWVRELIQNLNDEFDRPSIVQGAIYDITERKISEDEIRRQNKFLKTIMESLDHPFYVIDANDYTVKMANSAAAAGPLSKEVKCYSLTHRRNTPCCETDHRCPLAEVKRNKKPATVEHIHYDKDDKPRHYEVHAYPIMDNKGDVNQIIEYCLDITERLKAEEDVRVNQAELGRLWHINTAGEMASGIAHELNQPLCAIANYSSGCLRLLKNDNGISEKVLDSLEKVKSQADRAGKIITRLRRMVAKNLPTISSVDINDTIQQISDMIEFEAKNNSVNIQTRLAKDLPPVMADSIQIQQVILNLIRNSLEAISEIDIEKGELAIETSIVNDNTIKVIVSDNGRGITSKMAEKVFDPFFTTKTNGLGIGLSLSRSIIEAHGGKLMVKPNRNRGAVFTFTLPMKGK